MILMLGGFFLWDPETGSTRPAADPLRNNFCSGHAYRPDGTLLVSGGEIDDNIGLITATIYDPYTDFWTSVPDMSGGRWYPSSTTLANGDILVSSASLGSRSTLTLPAANELPQVFEEVWTDWRNLTTEFPLPLYPKTFLAPNGSVFFALPQSGYLDTSGTGQWTDVASRIVGTRDNYGSAVMYQAGKVMIAGGGETPTATCEMINLNDQVPSWQFTDPMAQPRRQHNVTLLADGKVLATGGTSASGFNYSSGAVLAAEMWDPSTGLWAAMASNQRYRGSHSTALLLPDGRVLSAGGSFSDAEVYSPPYLFGGIRPKINVAPTSIDYGVTFSVETADIADAIDFGPVNILRLGSVTHSHNFDQRFCSLGYNIDSLNTTTTVAQLTVTAPTRATDCPPGPYMLFVLNSSGVPSVAEIVLLAGDTPNIAPVANDDSAYSVAQGGTLNVAAPGVLDNDTDVLGDTLTAMLSTGPTSGAFGAGGLGADGSFSYTPDPAAAIGSSATFTYVASDGTLDSASATVTITVTAVVNQVPVADAGSDQTVTDADDNGTQAVTLDGTGSSDPDGTIASYDWSVGGSPSPARSVIFTAPEITFPIGTAFTGPQTFSQTVAVDAIGFENLTLSFTIAGIDDIEPDCGTGGSSDCFEVSEGAVSIVGPFDIPCVPEFGPCDPVGSLTPFGPTALASADTIFDLTFLIQVTDGFDEGAIFSNITVEGAAIGAAPIIAGGATPTVTLALGVHSITLTVTDNDGATDTDIVVVTVEPPVANPSFGVAVTPSADALSGAPGATVPYTLTVTNTGNVSDSFDVAVSGHSWSTTPSPSPIGPIAAGASSSLSVDVVIPGAATDGQFDTATITLTSQGNGTATASSTLTTTAVVAANTAPTVTISAPTEGAGFTAGASVSFSGSASDAEDGALTSSLSWTSNLDGTIGSGGAFSTSTLSVGAHLITALVTDSGGLPGSDQVNITVNPPEVATSTFSGRIGRNAAITHNVLIEVAGQVDATLSWIESRASLNLTARDPNNTVLASGSGSSPINVSFATTASGTYAFVIENTTRRRTDYTLSVTYPAGSPAPSPTLTSVSVAPASPAIEVGQTQQFSATGTFSDGSTADLTASAAWSSSTTAVATISASGLASGDSTGTTDITALQGGITSNAATLTVTAPPPDTEPPSISVDDPGFSVSGTVTLSATASDNVGVTQVEFLVDGISIGIDTTAPYSVGWNTAAIADGDHTITAVAEDAAGNVGLSLPVTVTVANAAPPAPVLSLSVSAPASAARGDEFTVSATIDNGGGSAASGLTAALSWTPSGDLRLRGGSATQSVATISAGASASVNWTMRGENEGTVNITVTISDGSGTILEQSVSMQINK